MHHFTRRLLSLGLALGLMAGLARPVQAQQANIRIAIIDLQSALLEVEDGRRAKAQIEAEYERRNSEVRVKEDEIRRMQEEVETQGLMVDPAVQAEREATLQRALLEYQQMVMESQQAMVQMEQTLTADIINRMVEMAGELAQAQGIDLVLEVQSVVYAPDSMDMTPALVRAYNNGAE